MAHYAVRESPPLRGEIPISTSKNAVLPIMCGALLTGEDVRIERVPELTDVKTLCALLASCGCSVKKEGDALVLNAGALQNPQDEEDVRKMRASYYVLGPVLAREGHVELSLPGGCAIGARPMDIHLSSLEQMGATIEIKNGYVHADIKGRLKGAHITFHTASVGATCNILMAATLAEGETVIENAAKEPEIGDLIDLLTAMGAKIEGRDSSKLTIQGVDKLHGAQHKVIADRIEAGSYAIAAAITNGRLELINAQASTLRTPIEILRAMGVSVEEGKDSLLIDAKGKTLTGQDIMTDYYPGFPTDLQAQFMALMTVSEGASLVTENIWENRFMHVPELMRMGANINVHGHASAIVRGVKRLSGAPVMATDLRASFALVLAGLAAEGETVVNRVYHLDRGYEKLDEKLRAVGADIERIKEAD